MKKILSDIHVKTIRVFKTGVFPLSGLNLNDKSDDPGILCDATF